MPFVTNRGQRIHYTVEGDGPLVLLQHGYLSSTADWKTCGYVDVLTEAGFRVACVDSLAHGESDKPTDPDLYALPHRADDIVAVLDDLGTERAHLVGYSMGGWIAGGVATHHPERLASVTIAGWDCVRGVDTAREGLDTPVDAKVLLEGARAIAPAFVAWVTPEVEEAVLTCGNAITGADFDHSAGHQRPHRAGAVLERHRGPVPPHDERVGARPRPPVLLGAGRPPVVLLPPRPPTPPPAWPTSSPAG